MWLVRLRIRLPRPLARGDIRFIVEPSSTITAETYRVHRCLRRRCVQHLRWQRSSTSFIRTAAFFRAEG